MDDRPSSQQIIEDVERQPKRNYWLGDDAPIQRYREEQMERAASEYLPIDNDELQRLAHWTHDSFGETGPLNEPKKIVKFEDLTMADPSSWEILPLDDTWKP